MLHFCSVRYSSFKVSHVFLNVVKRGRLCSSDFSSEGGCRLLNHCWCMMRQGSYFERTRRGMTPSPIFSFSLCFFFLFLFAFTVESSLFSFPSSMPLSVSLWVSGSKKGNNWVNRTTRGFIAVKTPHHAACIFRWGKNKRREWKGEQNRICGLLWSLTSLCYIFLRLSTFTFTRFSNLGWYFTFRSLCCLRPSPFFLW